MKITLRLLILSVVQSAFLLAGISQGATAITPKDAAAAVAAGTAILVDVREHTELQETGKARPAKWLATTEIQAKGPLYQAAASTWSKTTTVIFYCRSGNRSGKAADHFQSLGFKTLNAGAFQAWKDAGLPVDPVH
jgi:rhodanese-related sulfurtransferase